MKRMLLSFVMVAATLTQADAGKPAIETNARKTITRQYDAYRMAMMRHDTPAIMGLLTTNFTWHLPDGKVLDRHQTQDELKTYFQSVKRIEEMTITVQKITVQGNTAATLVKERVTALMKEPNKQPRTKTTEVYRELWVKTPQGWKIQQTNLLKS